MPTAKTLLDQFTEEQRIGKLGTTSATGDSTSVIDGSTRFAGPKSGNEWARGDPIRITSGTRINENTEMSDYEPASGDFTVLPALTGAPASSADFRICKKKYVDHQDRLYEALSRGLNRWAKRRMKVPLTYVTDGDLLGAAVATYWTGTNATPTYVDLAHPNGHYTRVLNIVTSAANGYAVPASIPVHPGDQWDFLTWMRANAAASTAEIIFIDVSNSNAVITASYSAGAATTSSRSLIEVRGTLTIPTGCTLLQIRLSGQENPATVQFGPFIAAPQQNYQYATQARFEWPSRAGKFFTRYPGGGTADGPEAGAYEPLDIAYPDMEQVGWGIAFQFRDQTPFPLYYEDLLGYADLSAEADSTHCPEDLALAAMAREFWTNLALQHPKNEEFKARAREAMAYWPEANRQFGPKMRPGVQKAYSGGVRFARG